MTVCTWVRARTSCSVVSRSRSILFSKSRCRPVFNSWYVLYSGTPLPCGNGGVGVVENPNAMGFITAFQQPQHTQRRCGTSQMLLEKTKPSQPRSKENHVAAA